MTCSIFSSIFSITIRQNLVNFQILSQCPSLSLIALNIQITAVLSKGHITDKRTDAWSWDFIIWKNNSGLWAVAWARLWEKRPIMSNFWGPFFHFFGIKKNFENFFENTIASALKSCIIIFKFSFWGSEKVKKQVFFRAKNATVST